MQVSSDRENYHRQCTYCPGRIFKATERFPEFRLLGHGVPRLTELRKRRTMHVPLAHAPLTARQRMPPASTGGFFIYTSEPAGCYGVKSNPGL
jgi:hypothetical protein